MRSPAVPSSRREFSAALYSVGTLGLKATSMSGCAALKAGMMTSLQTAVSAFRQLSIVRVVLSVAASDPLADAANASAAHDTTVQPSTFAERILMSPTALAA